ncbi:hypothetical protein [Maribacter luteus]|uniref:hypothetical protein n=1 Tax=Maribacter luteus TaxID=2594478 RepID=UPI0024933757|nr:hypothetical protein [Maribacter luteus]
MRTIRIYLIVLLTLFMAKNSVAQDEFVSKIETLKDQKARITQQEKEALKYEVEKINKQLSEGVITEKDANLRKQQAAELRALNIENRIAIIDNKISLINRNNGIELQLTEDSYFKDDSKTILGINIERGNEPKFEKRTYTDLVIAFGLNNAVRHGESFSDSPYKFIGSRFFEIGYAWNTRISKNSNWIRIKYGVSFQFNGLKPTENRFFTVSNDIQFPVYELTRWEGHEELFKSKLRMDNLVFPFHFEFGPSKKRVNGPYVRYSTNKKFKFGIGGYVGFNYKNKQTVLLDRKVQIGTVLSSRSGGNQKTIYGVSAYVGRGDVSLYLKYDLTQIFPGPSLKQNNISLGLRFDL